MQFPELLFVEKLGEARGGDTVIVFDPTCDPGFAGERGVVFGFVVTTIDSGDGVVEFGAIEDEGVEAGVFLVDAAALATHEEMEDGVFVAEVEHGRFVTELGDEFLRVAAVVGPAVGGEPPGKAADFAEEARLGWGESGDLEFGFEVTHEGPRVEWW